MSKLDQQFYEDRALRDAARKVILADIEHARASFSGKGIADRLSSRVGDGTKDVLYVAKHHVDENRGVIALLIGALALFFSRATIMQILGLETAEEYDDEIDDTDRADTRSVDGEQDEILAREPQRDDGALETPTSSGEDND